MGARISHYRSKKMSLIGDKYRIDHKIGQGSFGTVFYGVDTKTKEGVALKLELKPPHQRSFLAHEAYVYKLVERGVGFPSIRWLGHVAPFYDVLILDLLGPNLGELFRQCACVFSLKTVIMLADQMISRLEYLHNMNILHRDIKPENFLMGVGVTKNTLYLVDFGLSKTYRDCTTNKHISYREGKTLTGTARYASLNNHRGIEYSRRDDLESVGYLLVYFLRGRLPWQGAAPRLSRKQRHAKIGELKRTLTLEEVCEGCPREFFEYLTYCRNLLFSERPDYAHLRKIFRNLFRERGFVYDYDYDWSNKCLDLEV